MKVLAFTTVFPNDRQPLHGRFVAERLRHATVHADVRVVAPVPWFRPRRASRGTHAGLRVVRPRFYYVPGVLKPLDAVFLFLSALAAVARIRRRFDFDLIDAHFGYPDGVAAVLLGRWFRRPVVITIRGSELEMARHPVKAAAMRWAFRRAARVVAVSAELRDLATRLGATPAAVSVIGNGVDLDRCMPGDRAAARRSLGVDASATLLVSVGHLASVKGFHLILGVLPRLVSEWPALRYAIVGGPAAASGRYPAQLRALVTHLGLEDRVTITGAVPPDDVVRWLNAADLFVLASEREGSPNALREALACGCPVVASNVGDVSDVLPECAGLIVRDGRDLEAWTAAIGVALRRPWSRLEIRQRARRLAWRGVAARVGEEWRSALPEAGTAPGTRTPVRAGIESENPI